MRSYDSFIGLNELIRHLYQYSGTHRLIFFSSVKIASTIIYSLWIVELEINASVVQYFFYSFILAIAYNGLPLLSCSKSWSLLYIKHNYSSLAKEHNFTVNVCSLFLWGWRPLWSRIFTFWYDFRILQNHAYSRLRKDEK